MYLYKINNDIIIVVTSFGWGGWQTRADSGYDRGYIAVNRSNEYKNNAAYVIIVVVVVGSGGRCHSTNIMHVHKITIIL